MTCRFAAVALIALVIQPGVAQALVLDLNSTVSGAISSGTAPYLTATLEDSSIFSGSSAVKLTLAATGLLGRDPASKSEFVMDWYFNTTPVSDLSLAGFSGSASETPVLTLYSTGHQADGTGTFNIGLTFPDGANNSAYRFLAGETYSLYLVSSQAGFSTSSFVPNLSGNYTSAHIANTGPSGTDSAWVANVPEPSTAAYVVGAFALGSFTLMRRRPNTAA